VFSNHVQILFYLRTIFARRSPHLLTKDIILFYLDIFKIRGFAPCAGFSVLPSRGALVHTSRVAPTAQGERRRGRWLGQSRRC